LIFNPEKDLEAFQRQLHENTCKLLKKQNANIKTKAPKLWNTKQKAEVFHFRLSLADLETTISNTEISLELQYKVFQGRYLNVL